MPTTSAEKHAWGYTLQILIGSIMVISSSLALIGIINATVVFTGTAFLLLSYAAVYFFFPDYFN